MSKMEKKSIPFSEDKNHLAELIIDTKQVIDNLKAVKETIKPETKLMLVVKAWAYGFGAISLIELLNNKDLIDYIAVANVDEGVEIRKAGIKLPIIVLSPTIDSFKDMVKYNLEVVLYSIDLVKELLSFLSSNNSVISNRIPIHLKFNTGMNRLGFDQEDVETIKSLLINQSVLEVKSLMTHLSSASIEEEDEFTLSQLTQFELFKENLQELITSKTMLQALNSAGTIRFPRYQMDMVRIGIAAYGGINLVESKNKIKPAAIFKSKVMQCRRVKAGSSISYSRSGEVESDSNIACISVGYGDGFNRKLGNGNWEIEINGKLYPTIGNVCMDITMINLKDDEVATGDEVIVFGGIRSLFEYAEAQETISYESLTSISRRVKRTYI